MLPGRRAKNEQFPLFIPRATARRSHRGIRPMVYILKGKVSWLRLMAIRWTASSDAARQACGKAAARWGHAPAVRYVLSVLFCIVTCCAVLSTILQGIGFADDDARLLAEAAAALTLRPLTRTCGHVYQTRTLLPPTRIIGPVGVCSRQFAGTKKGRGPGQALTVGLSPSLRVGRPRRPASQAHRDGSGSSQFTPVQSESWSRRVNLTHRHRTSFPASLLSLVVHSGVIPAHHSSQTRMLPSSL
jgi:hypothetical protein